MIEAIKNTVIATGRLWLLFAALFVSNLFLIYSPEGMVTFTFSGITVPKNTAIYMTYEHLGIIAMAWILANPSTHRYMYKLFLWICIVDMFFFMMYYKSPVLWNPLKCVAFGAPLIYETWKNFRHHYRNS